MSMKKKTIYLFGIFDKAEEGGYLASCPELEIHTEGETLEEAQQNLSEAIDCYFETAAKLGHLDQLSDRLTASQDCEQIEKVIMNLKPMQFMNRIDRALSPA